jgi:hypothetical protein
VFDFRVPHPGQVGDQDVRGGLEQVHQPAEPELKVVAGVDGRSPRLSVDRADDGEVVGAVADAEFGYGLVESSGVCGEGVRAAAQFLGQECDVEVPAVAGQRSAAAAVIINESRDVRSDCLTLTAGSFVLTHFCPSGDGREDVRGEVVDESRRPGDERAEDLLGDPVGGVLDRPGVARFVPSGQPVGINREAAAGQDRPVAPEQSDHGPRVLPFRR